MASITVQGAKFEVPEAATAKYVVGYTLSTEGEVHAIRQTMLENLRNNFAVKVKDALNGGDELPADKKAELDEAFSKYALEYEFGVRAAGGGSARIVDPVEREMHKLAKADLTQRYQAKYNEKPAKEWLEETVPQYVERAHDDLSKRARAIIRQRQGNSQVLDDLFPTAA